MPNVEELVVGPVFGRTSSSLAIRTERLPMSQPPAFTAGVCSAPTAAGDFFLLQKPELN
jgi:hypothetical protein